MPNGSPPLPLPPRVYHLFSLATTTTTTPAKWPVVLGSSGSGEKRSRDMVVCQTRQVDQLYSWPTHLHSHTHVVYTLLCRGIEVEEQSLCEPPTPSSHRVQTPTSIS